MSASRFAAADLDLAVQDVQAKIAQIQRKLGPYIDTFLTSKLLAELDGNMGDAQANARLRRGLEKCVAKIEKNQLKDGSWNCAGGWAPILGTSLASQSLYVANSKGVKVERQVMAKVDDYTTRTVSAKPVKGDAQSVPVTLSIGVATLEPDSPLKEQAHLLKAADLAVYAAKHGGKNCVKVFSLPGAAGAKAAKVAVAPAVAAAPVG